MARPDTFTRDAAQITVTVRGRVYTGWLSSEVTRDLESISATFSIPVALTPGAPPDIRRQDEVQIHIGKTLVVTGYVLAAAPFYSRGDCGMRIMGRDRTGDLVRSSAIHKGGQWRNTKIDQICRDLAKPFGLQVVVDADIGAPVADFKLTHGEVVVDAMARAARLRGVMVTRDSLGRLVLSKAGARRFAGAIVRGLNVISMQDIGTDDGRHSEYIAYGQCNVVADFETARTMKARAVDADMKRYMPLVINADGNTTQAELDTLVKHTLRVRRGHSMGLRYVVEGWTYENQAWPLNERVPIYDDVAGLDGAEWLISSVRQTCDLREGDVTELTLHPIEAYDTAPLKTKVKHRNWGNKGNTTNHPGQHFRGPTDGAQD